MVWFHIVIRKIPLTPSAAPASARHASASRHLSALLSGDWSSADLSSVSGAGGS
jgi:hypothetical protein